MVVRNLCLVDSNIHPSVVESIERLREKGLGVTEDLSDCVGIVTQDRDVDRAMIEKVGDQLEAIVVLEPSVAHVSNTDLPVYHIDNLALLGVAEHTILLMLMLSKKMVWVQDMTKRQAWTKEVGEPELTDQAKYGFNWIGMKDFGVLCNSTVGLIGLGYIGKCVARMLQAFQANIIYNKRTRLSPAEEASLGVQWCELPQLLKQSDFVSLHHRFEDGADGNDNQFDADAFSQMKSTAFFINTARGRMVDEDALCNALESGEIAGAALDVFRHEPLPKDHPFFDISSEKLIITPHLAGVPSPDAANLISQRVGTIFGCSA